MTFDSAGNAYQISLSLPAWPLLHVEGAALKYRRSFGAVTTVVPASSGPSPFAGYAVRQFFPSLVNCPNTEVEPSSGVGVAGGLEPHRSGAPPERSVRAEVAHTLGDTRDRARRRLGATHDPS